MSKIGDDKPIPKKFGFVKLKYDYENGLRLSHSHRDFWRYVSLNNCGEDIPISILDETGISSLTYIEFRAQVKARLNPVREEWCLYGHHALDEYDTGQLIELFKQLLQREAVTGMNSMFKVVRPAHISVPPFKPQLK